MEVLLISAALVVAFAAGFWLATRLSSKRVRRAEADLFHGLYARQALVDHIRHDREHAARMVV